jgi:hypothetical protein
MKTIRSPTFRLSDCQTVRIQNNIVKLKTKNHEKVNSIIRNSLPSSSYI